MSFTASPFRSYELTKSPGAHAAVSQSNTSARAGAALKMARKIAAITQKRRGQILIYNFHKLFPGQAPRKFAPNHCVPVLTEREEEFPEAPGTRRTDRAKALKGERVR